MNKSFCIVITNSYGDTRYRTGSYRTWGEALQAARDFNRFSQDSTHNADQAHPSSDRDALTVRRA